MAPRVRARARRPPSTLRTTVPRTGPEGLINGAGEGDRLEERFADDADRVPAFGALGLVVIRAGLSLRRAADGDLLLAEVQWQIRRHSGSLVVVSGSIVVLIVDSSSFALPQRGRIVFATVSELRLAASLRSLS